MELERFWDDTFRSCRISEIYCKYSSQVSPIAVKPPFTNFRDLVSRCLIVAVT